MTPPGGTAFSADLGPQPSRPRGRPTAALAPGRRPKTTSTDYGIKFGAAERRRGGGPQDAGGGRAVRVVPPDFPCGYPKSWPSMAWLSSGLDFRTAHHGTQTRRPPHFWRRRGRRRYQPRGWGAARGLSRASIGGHGTMPA